MPKRDSDNAMRYWDLMRGAISSDCYIEATVLVNEVKKLNIEFEDADSAYKALLEVADKIAVRNPFVDRERFFLIYRESTELQKLDWEGAIAMERKNFRVSVLPAALVDVYKEQLSNVEGTVLIAEAEQFAPNLQRIVDANPNSRFELTTQNTINADDPKFVKLGDKLEKLREQHEQGLINSIEFLKMLLELAKEAAQAEKEVVPEEEVDKGKAALTELFEGVKNSSTPIIVERIVGDIDSIVKLVRFDGWQSTTSGKQEVKKALRSIVWVKYKIKDKELFDKAYNYIEQYY